MNTNILDAGNALTFAAKDTIVAHAALNAAYKATTTATADDTANATYAAAFYAARTARDAFEAARIAYATAIADHPKHP